MTTYHGRRAAAIENEQLRVTVLEEGGHIAEILDKETGVNPLWTPPWPTIEHSAYGPAVHAEYGAGVDGSLLAGIMGHNLCLDIFGGPSAEEAAAGLPVHGEGAVARYEIHEANGALTQRARFAGGADRIRTAARTARPGAPHPRDGGEPGGVRPADRVDAARHAGAAFPRKRRHAVPRFGHALQGLRRQVWRSRLSARGRGVRLALRAAQRWRNGRHAGVPRGAVLGRLHHAPDGPGAR